MPAGTPVLQLGHAGEGVEIATWVNKNFFSVTLQLGHAGEGVEIGEEVPSEDVVHMLQLGHAGEGVEIYALPFGM